MNNQVKNKEIGKEKKILVTIHSYQLKKYVILV